jgi:hypothetical protein
MATFRAARSGENGYWSFNSAQSGVIGYVKAGSTAERVVSITVEIATGNGTFRHQNNDGSYTGSSTTASGAPIIVYLKVGERVDAPNDFSNAVYVSNVSQSGSNREGCIAHTFTFPYPVEVPANTEWKVYYKISNDTYVSNKTVICHDFKTGSSPVGVTTRGGCKISNGDGTWTTAIPWISNGDGTWTVTIPWVSQGGGAWKAGI